MRDEFKSDSRLVSVALRAVVHFNVIHDKLASSLFTPENFEVIGDQDLAAPPISIITNDSHVSAKKNDFTSHVNTFVVFFSAL